MKFWLAVQEVLYQRKIREVQSEVHFQVLWALGEQQAVVLRFVLWEQSESV